MARFDVCNGDADGLCAAVQWQAHAPGAPTLVTGLKRDIALLDQVPGQAGDEVNVFDLSMQRNQAALRRLLQAGVRVRYVDHHATGEVPTHPLLQAHVDLGSEVCTSLLVDRLLGGAHRLWALVGAYGDNLAAVADPLAQAAGLDEAQRVALRRLGEGINYNAYGDSLADVYLPPARLYTELVAHRDPLDLLASTTLAEALGARQEDDMARARGLSPAWQGPPGQVWTLPDAPWARRVMGVLANALAQSRPELAQAVLCAQTGGGHVVSVRAPLSRPSGAAALCQAFGGNGRARAAGIDALPDADLPRFIDAFARTPWGA